MRQIIESPSILLLDKCQICTSLEHQKIDIFCQPKNAYRLELDFLEINIR